MTFSGAELQYQKKFIVRIEIIDLPEIKYKIIPCCRRPCTVFPRVKIPF
ncbi:hypothetical protein [Clostridium sp.]|nr:hypothetical protein [Clostridium sp.]